MHTASYFIFMYIFFRALLLQLRPFVRVVKEKDLKSFVHCTRRFEPYSGRKLFAKIFASANDGSNYLIKLSFHHSFWRW